MTERPPARDADPQRTALMPYWQEYVRKLLIAGGVLGGIVALGLLAWHIAQVGLIVFSAVLLAIFMGAPADWLNRYLVIGYLPCLALVILLLAAAVAGFGWLIGPNVSNEVNQLIDRLPKALAQIRDSLTSQHWAQVIMDAAPTASNVAPTAAKLLGPVTGAFSTAVGVILYVALVIVMATYLAVDPGIYRRGLLLLLPGAARARGREVLNSLGHALRWWLIGRISAMLVVAILTMIALAIIGMPMALALGLIAGLLSFVPFIGPVVAAVPAVLVGFAQGPFLAVAVIIVYTIVQFIESNFLTPLIQKRTVSLPPAILLSAQLLMGILFGFLGVLLATPFSVVIIVLVQMLYVQDVLGNRVRILGDRESS
jgi:predicted PurR-regulated permease PerM